MAADMGSCVKRSGKDIAPQRRYKGKVKDMTEDRFRLRLDLQFFAKDGNGGEKTEDATAKKLQDARRDGQVAKSMELVTALTLIALFLVLKFFVGYLGEKFMETFRGMYYLLPDFSKDVFNANTAQTVLQFGLTRILVIAVPIYLAGLITAFTVNLVQVKWKPTTKPLRPKFNKFNPISGFKKLFSKDKLVELLKSLLKIAVISYVVYDALKDQWNLLLDLYSLPLNQAIELIGNIIINLGLKISCFFLVIALADYYYQKRKFKEDMKMTKQEVKDEYKNSEGNPEIKGKIRQKMMEVSQRRMMQALPEADVVITNPTHLAVAVKYDKEVAGAPVVIAKGADFLAEKIKGIAKENQVEIVENKPLARMLYYNVELGDEIPPELYQMVAEILAYVYGLKGKI